MTTLMDALALAPTIVAVLAALATSAAALLVLHAVDLRVGGWLAGAGWLVVAVSAAWCAAAALLAQAVVPWPMALLAVALAVLAWADLDALMCRASCTHARHYVRSTEPGNDARMPRPQPSHARGDR